MTKLNCYFAYGSNLSRQRLRARVPAAVEMGVARLPHWALCFDKHGRDGSAKASIRRAFGQEVWGAVYRIDPENRAPLDAAEGLGIEYSLCEVQVQTGPGRSQEAYTYVALRRKQGLPVAQWYLDHILVGIAEHRLPAGWLRHVTALSEASKSFPKGSGETASG